MGDDATKLRVISSDLLAQASGTFRNAAIEAAIALNLFVEFAQHLSTDYWTRAQVEQKLWHKLQLSMHRMRAPQI